MQPVNPPAGLDNMGTFGDMMGVGMGTGDGSGANELFGGVE